MVLALTALTVSLPAGAEQRTYVVDAERSLVTIAVGKSGLFSFAGHQHEVVAPSVTGEVIANLDDLARSSVVLSFEASALRVTGKGEPPEDVPKVQANMVGPKVLDAVRFPAVSFRSVGVSGRAAGAGAWDLSVEGDFALHGVSKRLKLPLRAEVGGDTLTVSGTAPLRQTDFGIKPMSVAGVVNVKDELVVSYRIVARARSGLSPQASATGRRGRARRALARNHRQCPPGGRPGQDVPPNDGRPGWREPGVPPPPAAND
jgi:polyisoprenoid-binding protein YceI